MELQELTDKNQYEQIWKQQKLHVLQSWAWGEVKRGEFTPVRLAVLHKEAGDTEKFIWVFSLQVKSLKSLRIKFAYLPKLSFPKGFEKEILKLLKDYATAELHLDFLLLEFAGQKDDASAEIKALQTHPFHIQPQQTNQVKLAGRNLWSGLKGSYRQNARKAEKHSVMVVPYTSPNDTVNSKEKLDPLEGFYRVMEEIFKNTSFLPRSKNYFVRVWRNLAFEGKAKIFLARFARRIIGGYLVVYDESGAYELYGGVTREGRDLEAGYLLKYMTMLDAQKSGKQVYDHWGVAPKLDDGSYDHRHELFNISQFKEGFGGEYLEFVRTKAIVINPLAYNIFTFAQQLNKLKTSIRKKL